MPKKKLNIILGSALLIVWGLIMYKLFWDGAAEEVLPTDFTSTPSATNESSTPDSILLALDYRDPFLGARPKKPKKHSYSPSGSSPEKVRVKQGKSVAQPDPTPIKWPKISYAGLIENQENGRTVAIVSIDQQSQLLGVGDSASSVALVQISTDSILVHWNGMNKSIFLK